MFDHTFQVAGGMKKLMDDAGFVNIVEKTTKVPIGEWSSDPKQKELGRLNQEFHLSDLRGSASFVFKEEMKVCGTDRSISITQGRIRLTAISVVRP